MTRIKDLRKELGWNQTELAQALQTSRGAVANYEIGHREPDIKIILRLCEIFGCTADYLLGRSEARTAAVGEDDLATLAALHAAPESIRDAIAVLLAPYMAKREDDCIVIDASSFLRSFE